MQNKYIKYILPVATLIIILATIAGCSTTTAPPSTVTQTAAPSTVTQTAAPSTVTQTVSSTTKTTSLPPKDKIVIGASRPLSGANAPIGDAALGPIMKLWQQEVNADGGIYVKEYDKKLPIDYIIYDDTSDLGTMVRQTEKLIVEDKVDILFSACSTPFIAAQAPIANKYGKVLLTAEGGATIMKDSLYGLPYVFVSLSFSDWYELPVFAKMCADKGAKTAYIISIADLHGVEYAGVAAIEFPKQGIEIIANKSVPITATDFSLLVKEAKDANPDIFCVFAYPPIVLPVTGEAMAIGFNPPAMICGPGANFGFYAVSFGEDPTVVDGVSCFAAANSKTSPAFKEAYDQLEQLVGFPNLDWWGTPFYLPGVDIWKQAIEATGTLDQNTIRDYIANNHFDTILGDTYFTMFGDGGGLLAKETHPGEIGQWQDGQMEIVGGGDWPAAKNTADWIYPKPPWPSGP
jgi:branched-chain amino acid transport system substrate-binding protein